MNYEMIAEMPVVFNILRTAEREIFNQTGVQVNCITRPIILTDKERYKELLKILVCRFFQVSWTAICSGSRKSKGGLTDARHTYMFLGREVLKLTHVEVSDDCLCMDHTTSIYAAKKIKGFYDTNDSVISKIDQVKTALQNEISANQITNAGTGKNPVTNYQPPMQRYAGQVTGNPAHTPLYQSGRQTIAAER